MINEASANGNEVKSQIFQFWNFKTPTSTVPQEYINNYVSHAAMNPQYDVIHVSNLPERTKKLFPEDLPENFRIVQGSCPVHGNGKLYSAPNLEGTDFIETQHIAKASVGEFPEVSKDLESFKVLDDNDGGLMFDGDLKLHKPLPYPLIIQGKAAIHDGNENSAIALASGNDLMRKVRQHCEDTIPEVFERKDIGPSIYYQTKNEGQKKELDDVVNELYYNKYKEEMQFAKVEDLSKYVDYTLPPSKFSKNNYSFPDRLRLSKLQDFGENSM